MGPCAPFFIIGTCGSPPYICFMFCTHASAKRYLLLIALFLQMLASGCREKQPAAVQTPVKDAHQQKDTSTPPPYQYTQNDKYTEQVDFCSVLASKANVVLLGDSHTYRMFWNELLQRNDVVNRGIGSDITEGYRNRLQWVLKVKPKICFIEGGGNDIYHDVPVDTTIHNIYLIMQELKAHRVIPVLTHVFYAGRNYPNVDSNRFNEKVLLLNHKLDSLARIQNAQLINLDQQLNRGKYLADEYVQQDGIHLKAKAYLIWREEIRRILKKYRI